MPLKLEAKLDAAIASFVSDIRTLARRAALQAVESAFTNGAAPSAAAAPKPSGARAASRDGAKRSPRVIAATVRALDKYVHEHPGERIEEIARGLGLPSRELQLPARKLLSAGRVRTEGQKRATRYFPS